MIKKCLKKRKSAPKFESPFWKVKSHPPPPPPFLQQATPFANKCKMPNIKHSMHINNFDTWTKDPCMDSIKKVCVRANPPAIVRRTTVLDETRPLTAIS